MTGSQNLPNRSPLPLHIAECIIGGAIVLVPYFFSISFRHAFMAHTLPGILIIGFAMLSYASRPTIGRLFDTLASLAAGWVILVHYQLLKVIESPYFSLGLISVGLGTGIILLSLVSVAKKEAKTRFHAD